MEAPGRFVSRTLSFVLTATVLALTLALSTPARAQTGAGSIEGTVTDSSGAVIPGAALQVVNTATGVISQATTNQTGFYQVPGLFAGNYSVTASAGGMKTYQRTLELLAAQDAVINFSLSPGAVTQRVQVNANTVQLINTTSGTISATLENQRINQLPMNGRNIITLVNQTTPGLESCPESSSCANGQEGPALEYEVDGATLANREFGGVHEGAVQMVDPDALQEVHVETDGEGAQFAAPATAILSTKSGTDQLHGTLFETARNNAFGIARSRSNPSNYVAPQYIRNEFGGAAGGPIVIPHVYNGRKKSFWFFAYERYSLAQSVFQNEKVPTVAMRGGDFSGLTNSSNVLQQLYDPNTTASATSCPEPAADGNAAPASEWCRTPFSNNQIPAGRESPTAKVFNDITPLPSNSENPMVGNNLSALVPEYQVEPQITFRLDQVFNPNNRAYLRYTQNISTSFSPRNDPVNESYTLAADGLPAGASGIAYDPDAVFAAALGYTHIFSETFFSNTDFTQTWMGEQNYAGGTPFADFEAKLGLPNNFGEPGFPYVENIFQPMDGTQFQYGMTSKISQLDEDLTKTLGKHQLLFGGRVRFEQFGSRPDEIKDAIQFANGEDTGLYNPSTGIQQNAAYANTGQLNADEFLGAASSYSVNLEPPYQHLHDWEFDGYLQDNWRVRRNLTLNLGLRYEAHPAVWEGGGMMMGFDLKNDAVVTSGPLSRLIAEGATTQAIIDNDELDGARFETPGQAGLPSMLVNNYNFTWGPRAGVAWQPFGSKAGTVLRAGLGRFIYPVPIREGYRDVNRNNPFTAGYSESYTSAEYSPDGYNNYLLRAPQTVVMGTNSGGVINSSSTTAITPGISIVSLDPVYPPSYVTQGDVTIEQPAWWNSVIRVSYIYTHGSNLNNYFYYNDHPSEYDWEVTTGMATPNSQAIGPQNVNTGEGPYDQITWGSGSYQIQKSGWSNYNGVQANFEKLYRNGMAWQVMYVWSKSMRTGGDYGGTDADAVLPYSSFVDFGASGVSVAPEGSLIQPSLPPVPPSGEPDWGYSKALNRWENYSEDTNNPAQHLQFNGIIDLPFGRGKWLLGTAGRALNEVVGGWQLAGSGGLTAQEFPIYTENWGPTSRLHVYKHGTEISDCRSGTCLKGYEWFNGYIAPTAVSGNACAAGLGTVVNGLPAGWTPYETPGDQICSTPVNGKAVVDKYFGENEVIMNNVTNQKANTVIPYSPYPSNSNNGSSTSAIAVSNPFGHTILNGPMNFTASLSLFKVFPLTERVQLRFNVDAFNAFNNQGLNNPNTTDGTVCVTPGGLGCSSHNTPRQLQLTARLTF